MGYRYRSYSRNNNPVASIFGWLIVAVILAGTALRALKAFMEFCTRLLTDFLLILGFSKDSWPTDHPYKFILFFLMSLIVFFILTKKLLVWRKQKKALNPTSEENVFESRRYLEKDNHEFKLLDHEFHEYQDRNGYTKVFVPKYKHRMIAERLLKRRLSSDEAVHHIDGMKWNNDPSNLCVMDKMKHEHFHAWMEWKRAKENSYPSIDVLKRELQKDVYGGILLEKLSMDVDIPEMN